MAKPHARLSGRTQSITAEEAAADWGDGLEQPRAGEAGEG